MNKKLKETFEEWLIDSDVWLNFYQLTPSMQFGVYQDFYDSVGIIIYIEPSRYGHYLYILPKDCIGYYEIDDNCFETRQQAREEALKKAAEIWESQNE